MVQAALQACETRCGKFGWALGGFRDPGASHTCTHPYLLERRLSSQLDEASRLRAAGNRYRERRGKGSCLFLRTRASTPTKSSGRTKLRQKKRKRKEQTKNKTNMLEW